MRSVLAFLAIALVAISLWYLAAPPRDEGAYRERAARSAQTLGAQVRTAALWSSALEDGKTLSTSAQVGIADNARSAHAAATRFEGYEPPRGTDDVRRRYSDLASRVTTLLDDLDIAARRGEWQEIERARPQLERLGRELDAFRAEVRG